MDRLLRLSRSVALVGVRIGGSLLLCAAFVIAADVVLRKLFTISLGGAHELANFAFGISTAWALSFAMLGCAHVRVESLYLVLPPRLSAVLDLLAHAALTAVAMLITWYGFIVFKTSFTMGSRTLTPLATPLAVPQFFWFIGLLFFAAVAALLLLRSAVAFVTGDIVTVRRIIGPRSVSHELEQEPPDGDGRSASGAGQ